MFNHLARRGNTEDLRETSEERQWRTTRDVEFRRGLPPGLRKEEMDALRQICGRPRRRPRPRTRQRRQPRLERVRRGCSTERNGGRESEATVDGEDVTRRTEWDSPKGTITLKSKALMAMVRKQEEIETLLGQEIVELELRHTEDNEQLWRLLIRYRRVDRFLLIALPLVHRWRTNRMRVYPCPHRCDHELKSDGRDIRFNHLPLYVSVTPDYKKSKL
ncbi:unnamed protein product [Scytosiphon promiscuus]